MRALPMGSGGSAGGGRRGQTMRALPIDCGKADAGKAPGIFRKAIRAGDPCACC